MFTMAWDPMGETHLAQTCEETALVQKRPPTIHAPGTQHARTCEETETKRLLPPLPPPTQFAYKCKKTGACEAYKADGTATQYARTYEETDKRK